LNYARNIVSIKCQKVKTETCAVSAFTMT